MNTTDLQAYQTTKDELRQRDRATRAAHADRGAIEYYVCLVFDSDAMCAEFVDKAGLRADLDDLFLDGRLVAERLGIVLETPVITRRTRSTLARSVIEAICMTKGGDLHGEETR